jgi:hypothetical protein
MGPLTNALNLKKRLKVIIQLVQKEWLINLVVSLKQNYYPACSKLS